MTGAKSDTESAVGDARLTRIRLDEGHFSALVSGDSVRAGNVEICLADIGYQAMSDAVIAAMRQDRQNR